MMMRGSDKGGRSKSRSRSRSNPPKDRSRSKSRTPRRSRSRSGDRNDDEGKMEIAAILAKGLVRGLDLDLGLGPDPVLDLEVTRTKETKKFTTLPMRNNQQLIHEYFLWQFTLNNDFWKTRETIRFFCSLHITKYYL